MIVPLTRGYDRQNRDRETAGRRGEYSARFYIGGGLAMDSQDQLAQDRRREVELRDQYRILRHFTYAHLPADLATISEPFCELAFEMAELLPFNAETSTALRKLLEAKDAAVRSQVEAHLDEPQPD
jgi:hypothetical protein